MKISISKIKELRKFTGIGIMECKKALINSNGDIKKAIFFLKKEGKKISINFSKNKTDEGALISYIKNDDTFGTILGISCETDFLSKSKDFLNLLYDLSKKSVSYNYKIDFLNSSYNNEETVNDFIKNKIVIFKEKIKISVFETIKAPYVINYTHNNKIAALVGFSKKIEKYIAKNIAMHIVAMNPLSISENDFPKNILKEEKNIIRQQVENENKEKQTKIIEKIIIGKIKKLILDNTLINQKFIKDNSLTVNEYINKFEKDFNILSFKRINI
ncbi:translation elongation factor Ts [Blattabacterium cuenoti]|uniref:translation elongation factor Ts n=1 Tax=Blattabacterium cuenoti TaxID=1653831 RepID=UPI00163C10F3|nr:translation elongation factor Ts [Blattabacterium cuenoti]